MNAAPELGGEAAERNGTKRGISQAVAARAEHISCLNSQRTNWGRRGEEREGELVCGERATVASAAIVFYAPAVASFPLPSISFSFFLSFPRFSIRVSLAFPPLQRTAAANSLSLLSQLGGGGSGSGGHYQWPPSEASSVRVALLLPAACTGFLPRLTHSTLPFLLRRRVGMGNEYDTQSTDFASPNHSVGIPPPTPSDQQYCCTF